jgi:hypothetical protein
VGEPAGFQLARKLGYDVPSLRVRGPSKTECESLIDGVANAPMPR